MNKNFSITLTILSVIAVAISLFLRQADATVLNQNFSIETLYGDEFLINELFEISVIRQEGTNNFSRVVLTTGEAEITPIRFDARHQLDDRQLEIREFYRRTHSWARGPWNRNETENFRILTVDNWPNPNSFNILNTETGNLIKFEGIDSTHYFQNWASNFFLEQDGVLYLIITDEGQSHARIYYADFEREQFVFDFDIKQEIETAGTWFATDNQIYFYEMGGWLQSPQGWSEWVDNPSDATGEFNPETGMDTLTPSGRPLYAINFETQSLEPRQSPVGIGNMWAQGRWGDYLLIEGILTSHEDGGQGQFDGFSLVNLELGHRHVFQDTSWDDWAATQQSDVWGLTSNWRTDRYLIGDYLVGTTRINEFTQFIHIYDLTTMTQIYHGRINIRRDQGILTNEWGEVHGFEIRLREQ